MVTTASKLEIDGEQFSAQGVGYTIDRDVEYVPKEYELHHSPDKYGGITIPVPVDPYDIEPRVLGVNREGYLTNPADFPKDLVLDSDGRPISVEMRASGDDYEFLFSDVEFNPMTLNAVSNEYVFRFGDVRRLDEDDDEQAL